MDIMKTTKEKVLVADDDKGIRGLFRIVLEDRGYEVLGAESGPDTLNVFIRQRPSIVVLDLNMPGMDGFDVLARLHAADQEARIIVLTGWDRETVRQKAMSIGACEVFEKGCSLREVADFLQNLPLERSYNPRPRHSTQGI